LASIGVNEEKTGEASEAFLPQELEQTPVFVFDAAHFVVIKNERANATVLGQSLGLWLNLLGCKDARHWSEMGVAVHEFEIPSELFHPCLLYTSDAADE
jgi:hypothetical protein